MLCLLIGHLSNIYQMTMAVNFYTLCSGVNRKSTIYTIKELAGQFCESYSCKLL